MNIQGIQQNIQTDTVVGKKSSSQPQTAFSKVMDEVNAKPSIIGEGLVTYIKNWANTDQALERAMKKVGTEYRSVVELQRSVHQLSLHTEMMSRVGESLSSSIRRVEQMGNS